MREKKSFKKISDASVKETARTKNRAAHRADISKQLVDSDLFAVNMSKDGLKKKREKLAADRFKKKNTLGNQKSKTEVWLMKKLAAKGPIAPVKTEKDVFDVWGGETTISTAAALAAPSNRIQKFKNFSTRSISKIKAVVTPQGGQSVNPALNAHKKVLKQVIVEEEKEIEENYRGSAAQHVHGGNAAYEQLKELRKARLAKAALKAGDKDAVAEESDDDSDMESSEESEDVSGDEGIKEKQKPVDRLKKLTKNQRNAKDIGKEKQKIQNQTAAERKFNKQYDKVQVFINEDIKMTKDQKAKADKKFAEEEAERLRQEKDGVVMKAGRVGRKVYKMKKTDFQMEDELAASLRQVKPVGKDDFLRDRFDSVYRTNKLDVKDTVWEAEMKRKDRSRFRIRNRSNLYGTVAEKLDKKNKKRKAEYQNENKKGFLMDDLIML